jgi:hypothetical protein
MTVFIPDEIIKKPSYIINGLVPSNSLNINIGYAGSGKSIFMEAEFSSILHNVNFTKFKTIKNIDMLLIDQDTPENSAKLQLSKMHHAINKPIVNKLILDGINNYSFEDNSLYNAICEHKEVNPNIKLVGLDSLIKLSGGLNLNDLTDMNKLSLFKNKIFNKYPDLTISLNHHITEHTKHTFEDLMNENIRGLAMGSSIITQQADTILVLAPRLIEKGKLIELGIRPITKRIPLNISPFILSFTQNNNNMIFNYIKEYKVNEVDNISKVDIYRDIIYELKAGSTNKNKQSMDVNEMYDRLKGKYGIVKIRASLNILEEMKVKKCLTRRPYPHEYILLVNGKKASLYQPRKIVNTVNNKNDRVGESPINSVNTVNTVNTVNNKNGGG